MITRLFTSTLAISACLCAASSLFADELQNASVVKLERPVATANDNTQRPDLTRGVALAPGKTTLVVRLSSPEAVSALSFVNMGAQGRITVFASPVNLPTTSKRWQQVGNNLLKEGLVKSLVRPNDARYLKVNFEITQAGQFSQFGVYAATTVASRAKAYALLAADAENSVESDGKSVVDGKDLADSKDIPSEGEESPAEGPPPGLPDPPPFTFVPVLVPTSP